MTVNIVPPDMSPIVDDEKRPVARFFQYLQLSSALDPITGTGSPEGVEEARLPRFYVDTAASTGSILYVKLQNDIAGDRTKGWVLV